MPMGIGLGLTFTLAEAAGGKWWQSGSALDLDFANSRGFNSIDRTKLTPDSILTYTSPSPKMVYGADGVLGYTLGEERVSNGNFGDGTTGWTASGATQLVTGGVLRITNDAAAAGYTSQSFTTVVGVVYVISVNALGGTSSVSLRVGTSPNSVANLNVTPSGSVSYSFAATATTTYVTIRNGSATAGGYTEWDDISVKPVALPIDHDPITFDPLGVLIEERRTNLLTYSQQLDVINWAKSAAGTGTACIVTPNAGVAPDGTATADRAQFDRGANNTVSDFSTLQGPGATLSAVANTFSVWLKSYDGTTQYLRMSISGASIATKTITADWQRFDVTWVSTGGTFFPRLQVAGATGLPQTADVLVWGAQLEAGAFATSYIPTVASQVTRATDQVTILTSAFAYSATAGTVAVEAQVPSDVDGAVGNYFFSISDGTQSNLIHIAEINGVRSQIVSGAAVQFDSTVGAEPTTGVFIKAAVGYAANDMRLARGGSLGTADTSCTVPSGLTVLRVGVRADANFLTCLNGHIKRLTYFPTRRTDADLQVLST